MPILFYLLLINIIDSMGNKESEQKKEFEVEINHPRFSKSKIISNTSSKLLQTTQSIDEKEYDKWKASLLKY